MQPNQLEGILHFADERQDGQLRDPEHPGRQLRGNFVADVSYNGSAGRELTKADGPTSEDYNRFAGDLLDGVRNRLNPNFDSVDFNRSVSRSNYEGISLQIQRRYARGWSFQSVYTYAVSKDLPAVATEVTQPDLDYGYADNDVRHRLALNFVAEIPYRSSNPVLHAVLGGWQLNGIGIFQSGRPFSVSCTQAYPRCDFNADGTTNDRVNMPTNVNLDNITQDEWLNGIFTAADFTVPAPGAFGTESRNAFRGPGFRNIDFSLFKNFDVPGTRGPRSAKFQVRLELFNAANWVNFNNPTSSLTSGTFGRVTGARGSTQSGGPRVVQIGGKYIF